MEPKVTWQAIYDLRDEITKLAAIVDGLLDRTQKIEDRSAGGGRGVMPWDFRCAHCGRFISSKDSGAVGATPYGGYLDMEPPPEIFLCGNCADKDGMWGTGNYYYQRRRIFYNDEAMAGGRNE